MIKEKQRFESELGLKVRFQKNHQPLEETRFVITLTNRSKRPINVAESLSFISVVCAELRDEYGRLLDVWEGPIARWPVMENDVMKLAPLASISREFTWPRYYYGIRNKSNTMQCRFLYDTGIYVDHSKSNRKTQRANVFSNAIALQCENNVIRVVGDWHVLFPKVTVPGFRKDLELHKTLNLEAGRSEEALIDLCLIDKSRKRTVSTIDDLYGLVELKSPEEALRFVRLFTGIDTHYLFRGLNVLEVGENSLIYDDGIGVVLSSYWDENYHYEKPTVRKSGDSYVIERCLITYPDLKTTKSLFYRSQETVTVAGKYTHEVLKVIKEGKGTDKLSLDLPYY